MPRKPRYLHPHGLSHAILRGVDRGPIFRTLRDRHRFLTTLAEVVPMFSWELQAYCLMENHVHLLIDASQPDLSAGLHRLGGLYAQRFNRLHSRTGHLYEERFKAVAVRNASHRLSLHAYIPLNPVSAMIVERPEEFRWSSYRATAGLVEAPPFLSVDWVLEWFGGPTPGIARRRYVDFVAAYMTERARKA